ncbi:hypothetical protein CR513_44269, partial [Mucuna pruriens]
MCVDYRDLNRESPKDNFPLPHIDILVDNTTQHAFYSFMDGFSRGQRKNHLHYYLGNILLQGDALRTQECRATYQRAIVALFHDMMHKEVEVCVDDMIVKLKTPNQHAQVKPSQMHFWVNEKGIEVDLNKVKAIDKLVLSRLNAHQIN